MKKARTSGVLLHPTSLPGPYGIGDLGPQALGFADVLKENGQTYWQILPLTPTGFGDSPYSSFSAFAGNPLLISPDVLREEGLLDNIDAPPFPEDAVDYNGVHAFKDAVLRRAFDRFKTHGGPIQAAHDEFVRTNDDWLEDYALFMALKRQQ